MLIKIIAVALGGAIGALARYGIALAAERYAGLFPVGTFAANAIGCLAIGVVMWFVFGRPEASPDTQPMADSWRLFLAVGLLGSLTTFSTFAYESMGLMQEGKAIEAFVYVAASLGIGIGAVALGWYATRVLAA